MTRARNTADTQTASGGPVSPSIAGKNKIINGDFAINQRAFTSNTTNNTYNFDRWQQVNGGTTGTLTVTPQTFTPGAAPVAGYESSNFVQCVTASGASINTYAIIQQRIEDVRTFAGQTATISFWAKATSGTPKIGVETEQYFGSGGSPSSAVTTAVSATTLSTSWARYSVTVSVPSISGKTIGTDKNSSFISINFWMSAGSDFASRASSIGLQNATFQIWGVQVEAGSVATPFTTATGTIQGELAACQRYYIRSTPTTAYAGYGTGMSGSSTSSYVYIPFPVSLRLQPQAVDYSNLAISDGYAYVLAISNLALNHSTPSMAALMATHSAGATTARTALICNNNSTSGYIGFTAEL
jgi:hypothetical protein